MKKKILLLPAIMLILAGCGKTGDSVSTSEPVSGAGSVSTVEPGSGAGSVSTSVPGSGTGSVSTVEPVAEYISEAALVSARGALELTGTFTRTYIEYEDDYEDFNSVTVFAENKYYNIETLGSAISYQANLKNVSGTVYSVFLDETNTVAEEVVETEWENYVNPFISLKTTDFVKSGEGEYDVTGTAAKEVAYAAYGYYVAMDSVTVSVTNDKITEITFLSETFVESVYEAQVVDFGNFTVKNHGTAVVPAVTALPTLPGHADLAAALAAVSNSTVEVTANSDIYGEMTSTMKFGDNVVLIEGTVAYDDTDNPILGEYGYFGHEDIENTIYAFDIVEDELVITDFIEDISFSGIDMDLSSTVAEFFEPMADGLFIPHNGFEGVAALGIANPLFYGMDSFTSLSIQLDENKNLESISFDFETFDFNVWDFETGTTVITFTDVDSTVVPLDLTGIRAQLVLARAIPEDFIGVWHYIGTDGGGADVFMELTFSLLGIHGVTYIDGEFYMGVNVAIVSIVDGVITADESGNLAVIEYDDELGVVILNGDIVFEVSPLPGSFYTTKPITAVINEILGEDIVINLDGIIGNCYVMVDDQYFAEYGTYGVFVYFITDDGENVLAEIEALIEACDSYEWDADYEVMIFDGFYYVEYYEAEDGVVFYIS